MSKNILILVGSPRKNGNTEALVNAFIEGAPAAGHQTDKLLLSNLNIHCCLGCDYCTRNRGKCIQKDDMEIVYTKMRKSDVVVFASPLYYWGLSAQLKTVIDRFYASLSNPFTVRESVLLLPFGAQNPAEADIAVSHYKMLSSGLGLKDRGAITAMGVLNKNDILDHPALEEAHILGKNI